MADIARMLAVSHFIKVAERRTETLCKEHDPTNAFWQKFDELIENKEGVHK